MRSISVLAIVCIACSATQAADVGPLQYRAQTIEALAACRLAVATAQHRVSQGDSAQEATKNGNGTDGDGDWPACVRDRAASSASLLASAMKSAKRTAARDALKTYHSIYAGALQGVVPAAGERLIDYKSRQQTADTRLTEAWVRFELELPP